MSGALQCSGHHALVLWARASAGSGKDLGMGRHKAAQSLRVFVVYSANFVGAKVADFFDNWSVVFLIVLVISHVNK